MKESDHCLIDENVLHKNLLVYDLIYNPKETRLLAAAKNAGAKVSNGLGMLLYQGMISFQIWTGKQAPKEIMQKALRM
jgi:shikimate 5-dehydrogenase